MTIAEYTALTGITVPSTKTAIVTATIARTQSMLETLLGYTLNPDQVQTNLYNELGKSSQNCFCPSVNLENLQDPDAVVGAYRLYRYNELDKYFHVDPFSKLNAVKLVYIKAGDNPNGITIKTFTTSEIRVNAGRDGIAKYIEHCMDCLCTCDCQDCVQLAVDANWLWPEGSDIPSDLQYLWADMVTWYSDSKNKGIKSETIDTHSYTRFDKTAPEQEPQNLAVIKRYAGPYGSVSGMPV
jgi:hypothetical protein